MFVYDRLNYAKNPSVYYKQMQNVHMEHPEVYEHLKNGGMSVPLGMANTCGCILVDQAIEEIANRDTLDSRGHKRIQFIPREQLGKCYLTAEYRSICVQNLKGMGQEKPPDVSHADLEPARIKKDKQSTQVVVNLL